MSSPHRPNILFFLTDDQRFDTIRSLGNTHIITPHLDRLVTNGTAFTNAYIMGGSHEAVCMPSRAMLMTGRTLFHIQESGEDIAPEHVMLGETLQQAGYTTFGTGKWHNGPASYARSFTTGGEIFYSGMEDHWNVPVCSFDPTGTYAQRCNQTTDFPTQTVVERICDHIHAGRHSSVLFCDTAIDFLRHHDTAHPFFAYVAFMAPHDPRTMPPEYLAMYDPRTLPVPENFMLLHPFDNGEMNVRDEKLAALPRDPEEVRRHLAAYYGMISHLDAQIGRVLAALEETGQADNTIIIMAGDNGLALGRHGLMGKQNLYEHSIHVPLLMSGPGVPRNVRSTALVYLLDVYPTLCDLTGVPVPSSVEGKSLLPVLQGAQPTVRDHLLFAYRNVQRAVRDDRYKLIEYVVPGCRTTQVFDLANDPFEMNDLSATLPGARQRDRLRRLLDGWRDALGDTRADGRRFWQGFGA